MQLAFDHVVTAHGAAVLRVCRALVGIDDADDVWAEAFLSAMRAYPELPADANVEAWLVTIARRKGIDHLRARARRAVPVEAVPERVVAGGLGSAERLDLYAALALLPARQRECVAFHHLGGLPYAEVAAVLGGTEAAARRAAADGVRALRAVLGEPATVTGRQGASRTTSHASLERPVTNGRTDGRVRLDQDDPSRSETSAAPSTSDEEVHDA